MRDNNERTGLYSLSVRAKDSVKHFHVEYTGYSFKFGFNEFSSLKDFVKHFANEPLIGSETGTLIVLKHPYPREVEEPSIYESVRVHTAMQTGRTENDLVPTAPSYFSYSATADISPKKQIHHVTFMLNILPWCPRSSPLAWTPLTSLASPHATPALTLWSLPLNNVHFSDCSFSPPCI